MAYCYRAAWRILFTYFYRFVTQQKPFMVANIIARWAPPAENDTKAYIRTMLMLTGIGGQEKLLLPDNVESYRKLSKLLAAMTVMENGIPMEEVDGDAIWEGYRLAFPDNRQALAEYLTEEDEYRNW